MPDDVLALFVENQLPDETEDIPVLPENQLPIELFICCQTQWQFAGMSGVRVGMNWQSMELAMKRNAEFRALDELAKDDVFSDLVIIERVVLSEFRKREKPENKP